MHTIVRSATVGGAAASPIDPEVNVAPLRDVAHIEAADIRESYSPSDPWDPWAPVRIGYDAPAPASMLLPPLSALDRLVRYLNASLG